MPTLLYELENNEALLMMFISGELPPEDHAEVEQMLASDGGLRMELEEIRSAVAESMGAVAALDRLEPISVSAESVSLRNVSRLMKQWKVDRLRAQPIESARRAWRYPMWVYPTSAVASILVGVLVWWGLSSPPTLEIARTPDGRTDSGNVLPSGDKPPSAVVNDPTGKDVAGNDLSGLASNGVSRGDGRADARSDEAVAMLRNSFVSSEPAGLADAEAQAFSLVSNAEESTSSVFPREPAQ